MFEGAFVPPTGPGGVTPVRARTFALVIEPGGLVGDLSVVNVEFHAPAGGLVATSLRG